MKTGNKKHAETAYQLEDAINNLDGRITDYLLKFLQLSISPIESTRHVMLMETVRDIERIGDHFENIIELTEYVTSIAVKLTEDAMDDLIRNVYTYN